jgi:hypothetical protein
MATASDGTRPCVGKADRMTKIVCMEEAWVPYLRSGGGPRGGVRLGRDLKGVGVRVLAAPHPLLGRFQRWVEGWVLPAPFF